MYLRKPTKGDQYYDIAMDLYFNKDVGVTQITRQIPVGRSMIYRWITKFAIENGLNEPSDMSKDTATAQEQSALHEGQSGSTDDVQVLRARIEELEKQLRHEKMRSEARPKVVRHHPSLESLLTCS